MCWEEFKHENPVSGRERSLRFARAVGAPLATVHVGDLPTARYSPEHQEESYAHSLRGVARLLETAADTGLTLCVENGNGYDKIGFGHGIFFGRDPSYLVRELGVENVKLAHLHDNKGDWNSHSTLVNGGICGLRAEGRPPAVNEEDALSAFKTAAAAISYAGRGIRVVLED